MNKFQLTNEEQDTLINIFTGNDGHNNFEIISLRDDDAWGLISIDFHQLPIEIFNKLDIVNTKALYGEYTAEQLRGDEEGNECGFHIYWDKINPTSKEIKNELNIGLYTFSGGDEEFDFTLEDVFDKEHYKILFNFGFDKIEEALQMEEENTID